MKKIYLFLLIGTIWAACSKNKFRVEQTENEAEIQFFRDFDAQLNVPLGAPFDYSRRLPKYLNALGLPNPTADNWKATLGRVIFYDKNLSKDGTVSCASCHKQNKAFSDDVAQSVGVDGHLSERNSPPLANVASFSAHYRPINGSSPLLLWDNRAGTVAEQSKMAFENPHEMAISMAEVVQKMKSQNYYPYLWNKVFGDFDITADRALECLNGFVGAIGSQNTKLDENLEWVNGKLDAADLPDSVIINRKFQIIQIGYYNPNPNSDTIITIDTIVLPRPALPNLTPEENRGRLLFTANCTKCHSPVRPFQEVFEACNGLDVNYADAGIGKLTGKSSDAGVFKSPTLRNIAFTAPYMHDGRFKTLEEVVEFYSSGVQPSPNLHPLLKKNGQPKLLNLTPQQKTDLVIFLNTLSDTAIFTDEKFADPFKK